MAEIDGGALSFKSVLDNDQLDSAIAETMRRVQGFSDAVVGTGDTFDNASRQILSDVRTVLSQIGAASEQHKQAIAQLETQYNALGQKMADAYSQGRDEEYFTIQEQMRAIQGEIVVRKQLLAQLNEQSDALEKEASRMEQANAATEKAATAHDSLRVKIRNLREEMAALREQGIDENSEAYKNLANELGRLQDIQSDIQKQGSVLANDESQFAGVMSGLQGLVGGFTAVQGAMAMFAGENENLQKIMVKLQSLMSITIGLQQAAQTLNKDSAFSLVTLNGLREWWNNLLDVGRGKTAADTAAKAANTAATEAQTAAQTKNTATTTANAVAQTAQTASATAGTAANITLAGAFRMVGAAIKSIPVFGWIAAGIAALVAAVQKFTKPAREAKKAAEEFYKAVSDNVYKPIASVMDLQQKWSALGDDFEAKKKFVVEQQKAFDSLGVSVKGVTDAENLLSSNEQVNKFVQAQLKKAEAMVYMEQAQEKVKKLVESRQKEAAMSPTVSQFVQTSSMGTGYYVEAENKAKLDLQQANKDLETEILNGFAAAAAAEKEGMDILNEAGMESVKTYESGTLGAIENEIAMKQAALKSLTNNDDYQAALAEIAALQAQADAITGKKSSSKGATDAFSQKLAAYKAEYTRFQKWISSGDEILVQSANQEFAALLAEGATYIDYLKNQRDQILQIDIADRTKEQITQLAQLNDAIADETRQTVVSAFESELNEQLSNANNVIEMLDIIEERRKELSGDGSPIDNSKQQSLDEAENNVKEQMQRETDALLDEYASYIAKRKAIDEKYNSDLALLQARRAAAESESEQAEIDAAIANRTRQYKDDTKGTGNVDYDKMVEEYATFEERKTAISQEYDEKRAIAAEMNNQALLDALDKAETEALSKLAADALMNTEEWGQLFDNLDELTASQIDRLLSEIEGKFDSLKGSFNPIDLNAIRQKLNQAKAVLISDNPFKQVGQTIKEIFNDAGDDSTASATQIKKNWKNLSKSVKGSFDFINDAVDSCDLIGDLLGDVGKTALATMQTMGMTAVSVGEAIQSAEKGSVILAVIQAALQVCQAVANLVKSIIARNDAKIDEQIEDWQDEVDSLSDAYDQLSRQIDKALGTDVYKYQKQAIANMQQQQALLQQMWEAEESKKKTDSDKVDDYKEQYAELTDEIEDMYAEIADDILQTTATDFADTLGDALVNAFKSGEDAAKAFEETVNEVLQNAVVNQLKKKFLEEQLQSALDDLYDSMGYWNGDDFVFDGLTDAEIESFREKVQAAANNYNEALELYKDLFSDLTDDSDDSLTGAVKGVSEETASILAGQMNAIRINQLEATEVLRNSLQTLNTIASNTQYNRYLAKIDKIVSLLESNSTSAALRSQGLS